MAEEAGAQAPQNFVQRKAAQLAQERQQRGEVEPVTPQDPEIGTPSEAMESAEDVEQDDPQGLYADEGDPQGELDDPPEALDDETLSGQDQDPTGDDVNWEKRYKDLQSETQTIREDRGEMDQEHAQSMAEHLQLRFQLEDQLTEATQRAQFMLRTMTGNAQQFKNIDWSRVPPDKVQEVQAQAQQALYLEQQAGNAYEQMQTQESETREMMKQREAAIAKTRLRRSIPGWSNETYGEIRQFAAERGMPAEEFNGITSPVLIEALHAYRQLSTTGSSVQTRTNRKTAPPRGQAARRQPRNDRGQYANKQVEPNQRGSFADKHRHRLAMERQGR